MTHTHTCPRVPLFSCRLTPARQQTLILHIRRASTLYKPQVFPPLMLSSPVLVGNDAARLGHPLPLILNLLTPDIMSRGGSI